MYLNFSWQKYILGQTSDIFAFWKHSVTETLNHNSKIVEVLDEDIFWKCMTLTSYERKCFS
jgi:hypothetical protein